MKHYIVIYTFFFSCFSFSQYNPSAPWMQKLNESGINNPSINQIVKEFDQYWLTHDKNVRGSGHKPFMRWENHWRNKVDANGYLISPKQMWDAFNSKKLATVNRNTSVPTSVWEPIGPFTHTNTGSWSSGQGRVNVVYVDPSNANTIYIGTPAGGIWKSTTAGTNWIPLSDNLPQIGVSGIAVDPTNSDIIYISTGDCDGSDSYSIGVMKSIDGGLNWTTTGLTFSGTNTSSGDIMIHPTNSNILLVATSIGIFKSTNAGVNWSNVKTGNYSQGRLRFKPNDPNTVYAVSQNRFCRSVNSGDTFTTVTSGLPTNSGRMLLDVTPADENIVYLLSSNSSGNFQGVYKSTNGGTSFVSTNTTTNVFESPQSGYDLAFAVSSTNANELYTGCLNVWRSTNGGVTFTKRNNWSSPTSARYTHADIHYLRYFGDKLYCGSDGGVYVSSNNSTTFSNITASAQISQFYKIAVSKQSASKMMGGLQDNGGHAFSNNQWKNYYGADGMDTAIDPNNSNLFYGFIQFGGSLYISNNAGDSSSGGVSAPNGETGNWITPLVTNSNGELYAGYSNLFKLNSGSWVKQNTGELGIGNLNLITIDPNNNNIIYVSGNNEILKSTDKGVTFQLIYNSASGITSISVHSTLSNTIYITTGGIFGEVLKSTDGGLNFTAITGGLPNIGKNIVVHQGQNGNNPLFVGTSLGVYYRDDTMTQWAPFDTNLPNVSVTDLDINLEDRKITAATYGRGIWQAAINVEVPTKDIKLLAISNPISSNLSFINPPITPQIVVKNSGATTINTINIEYSYNSISNTMVWNGILNPNASTTITLPESIILPKDFYTLAVTASILNDEIPINNSLSKSFLVNTQGSLNQTNTFETVQDKLLSYDESGLFSTWERGISTGSVVINSTNNVYSTKLSGNYDNVRKAFLVSEKYNLTQITNPVLSFKMAYDLEDNYDLVYVEYSFDNGVSWFLMGEVAPNWYNSNRTSQTSGTDCINCPGAQWLGTNTALTEYSYPLNGFVGASNIMFRIVFHSDDSVNAKGVVIDDFLISATTLGNNSFELNGLAIYPNPSNGIFNISSNNLTIDSLELYDLSGKNIKFSTNNSKSILDLTNIYDGIYFVKITANNQFITKKIIKN